jgi:hypothetical protein
MNSCRIRTPALFRCGIGVALARLRAYCCFGGFSAQEQFFFDSPTQNNQIPLIKAGSERHGTHL